MELSQFKLAQLHLFALALGCLFGLLFDFIRFPHLLFQRKETAPNQKRKAFRIVVFLEDFLFCLFASVCTILLFYEHNSGKIRPFAVFLIFIGFVLYWFTLGKWVRRLLVRLANRVRKIACRIWMLVWRPLRKVILLLSQTASKMANKMKQQMEERGQKRETAALFQAVEQTAAGLLPGGVVLKKKKEEKSKGGKTHGRGKRKKDHCTKQESVA